LGKVASIAPIYETAAWGKTDQASFINTCIIVNTVYGPKMTFKIIKEIERQLERKSTEHWGPREIDIDILLFGSSVLQTTQLTIPHQQMDKRNFVLQPASVIAPNWVHPLLGLNMKELLRVSQDELQVKEWKK
jgi:2-amino-4-hydroxy-6-hydroxymethyldihydropteridine diphosphokinase